MAGPDRQTALLNPTVHVEARSSSPRRPRCSDRSAPSGCACKRRLQPIGSQPLTSLPRTAHHRGTETQSTPFLFRVGVSVGKGMILITSAARYGNLGPEVS